MSEAYHLEAKRRERVIWGGQAHKKEGRVQKIKKVNQKLYIAVAGPVANCRHVPTWCRRYHNLMFH